MTPLTRPHVVWTVAGHDPSSGAGVTADLMTFATHGLFGCSAVTALTVQTTVGVFASEPVRPAFLAATLDRLDEDLPPVGIKIGMLGTPEIARVAANFLARKRGGADRRPVVVLDPVLRSSSGRSLYPETGLDVLRQQLMPCVDWVTPNWAELGLLSGQPVTDLRDAEAAACWLTTQYTNLTVVATGGDQDTAADLVVTPGAAPVLVRGEQVETTSTHGTGCAFSSALLARLVAGEGPLEAVRGAKAFVEGALRGAPQAGPRARADGPVVASAARARADVATLRW